MLNEMVRWKRPYVCLSGTGYVPFSNQSLQIYVIIVHIPIVINHDFILDTYGSTDNGLGKWVRCG
jgi:hypothetical protein